jgi:hypothetical protein
MRWGLLWNRREKHMQFWWENLKETDHLKGLGIDVINEYGRNSMKGPELHSSKKGKPVAGCCKHSSESYGSTKCREYFD